MHESIVPDLHEAGWQYVLEKSPDELEWRKIHGLVQAAFRISVSQKYLLVFHGDDTTIRNSSAEYV